MPTKNFPSRVNLSFRGGRRRDHHCHLRREGFSSLTSFMGLRRSTAHHPILFARFCCALRRFLRLSSRDERTARVLLRTT
jgi:hypothetical protein